MIQMIRKWFEDRIGPKAIAAHAWGMKNLPAAIKHIETFGVKIPNATVKACWGIGTVITVGGLATLALFGWEFWITEGTLLSILWLFAAIVTLAAVCGSLFIINKTVLLMKGIRLAAETTLAALRKGHGQIAATDPQAAVGKVLDRAVQKIGTKATPKSPYYLPPWGKY